MIPLNVYFKIIPYFKILIPTWIQTAHFEDVKIVILTKVEDNKRADWSKSGSTVPGNQSLAEYF